MTKNKRRIEAPKVRNRKKRVGKEEGDQGPTLDDRGGEGSRKSLDFHAVEGESESRNPWGKSFLDLHGRKKRKREEGKVVKGNRKSIPT